jgi:plastocyanin
MKKWILSLGLLGLVVASACGGAQPPATTLAPTPTTSTPALAGTPITISDYTFLPTKLTVAVGATVTWTNTDNYSHTVVSDSGLFSSGSISTGNSFSYTFKSAGTFAYHCSVHPYMTGMVIVQ